MFPFSHLTSTDAMISDNLAAKYVNDTKKRYTICTIRKKVFANKIPR